MLLASATALGMLAARRGDMAALNADARTAVGETRRLALADGSELWLNTDSVFDIDSSAAGRNLVLHRGEMLMHGVAAPRPIVVGVVDARLTTPGARFSVRRGEGASHLAVLEGAVRLDLASGAASCLVPQRMKLRFDSAHIGGLMPADSLQTAWIRKRLSVETMRLGDVIAILARYRYGHLGCDPAVVDLQLTGSYQIDDVDRILAILEWTLPVRVARLTPLWVSVEPPRKSPRNFILPSGERCTTPSRGIAGVRHGPGTLADGKPTSTLHYCKLGRRAARLAILKTESPCRQIRSTLRERRRRGRR